MTRWLIILALISGIAHGQSFSMKDSVRVDLLMQTVNELSGAIPAQINGNQTTIISRYWNDPGNAIAQSYLLERFEKLNWQVRGQAFGAKGMNIIASKEGVLFPHRKIIFSAHFDSMPNGVSPGADDNATGVAAILELARIFSNSAFPITVELICWDEEEWGLVGSTHYVNNLPSTDTLVGVVNLDMLGWDGNNDRNALIHTSVNESDGALASLFLDAQAENDTLFPHVLIDGIFSTDHIPFSQQGHTAISITEDYEHDLNPNWHLNSDLASGIHMQYFKTMVNWVCNGFVALMNHHTSILQIDQRLSMKAFPNPAGANATISCQVSQRLDVEIAMLSPDGKKTEIIYRGMLNEGYYEFNVSSIQNGVALVYAFTKQGNRKLQTVKLVFENGY